MTDNSQNQRPNGIGSSGGTPAVKTGNSGIGMVVAAVILVVGIIAAIWYFQASGGATDNTDVTISIDPNSDPGVATTISP